MIVSILFPGLLALVLGYIAQRRSPAMLRAALRSATGRFIEIMPKIAVALIAAGFIGKLVPASVIGSHIGPESGASGIMLATVIGGIMPGGPIVTFPVVIILLKAGAGFPQVVAFLTGWSVFALHRMIIYEIPMMGWQFSVVRLTSSLILPPLAGFLTIAVIAVFGAPARIF